MIIIGTIILFLVIGWCVFLCFSTLCYIATCAKEGQDGHAEFWLICLLWTMTIFIHYLWKADVIF